MHSAVVVVVGIDGDGRVEVLHGLRDQAAVGGHDLGADVLGLLGVAVAIVRESGGAQNGGGVLVGLRPVDDADGVVGLGVLRIELNDRRGSLRARC